MTSHGVKVAAFNLAEMKSKEADRREEDASARVVETDFELAELARQWCQLRATADRARKASEAASAEALQLAVKMVRAEEELDESRRLSEEETRSTAVAGVEWETHHETWSAGPGPQLGQASGETPTDIVSWLKETNDVPEERKRRLTWMWSFYRWGANSQAIPMSPGEAKSFAATRSDIYGFTYNKHGSRTNCRLTGQGGCGGSAWFKTTRMSGCKSVWSEETPPSNGKGLNKYEWHDHYEKTS